MRFSKQMLLNFCLLFSMFSARPALAEDEEKDEPKGNLVMFVGMDQFPFPIIFSMLALRAPG